MSEQAPNAAANGAAQANAQGPQVQLQKIFLKDASVEVPGAPMIFTKPFQPKVDVQLNTDVTGLGNNTHQVVLSATITARLEDEVAYLVEIQMAGLLTLQNATDGVETQAILGAWAPNQIFPFLRESVSEFVQRAGFPPFLMQPVNFEAAFRDHLVQQKQKGAATEQPASTTH